VPEELKDSIIAPIYKKGDITDCSGFRGISIMSPTHIILSSILLSRLTPYAKETTIEDHQCGFRRYSSAADPVFCIRQILGVGGLEVWGGGWVGREYNEAVHQIFIDFKKAYDSVRRQVLFGIHMNLVRLTKIKMCLNETYKKVRVGKYFVLHVSYYEWFETR